MLWVLPSAYAKVPPPYGAQGLGMAMQAGGECGFLGGFRPKCGVCPPGRRTTSFQVRAGGLGGTGALALRTVGLRPGEPHPGGARDGGREAHGDEGRTLSRSLVHDAHSRVPAWTPLHSSSYRRHRSARPRAAGKGVAHA